MLLEIEELKIELRRAEQRKGGPPLNSEETF